MNANAPKPEGPALDLALLVATIREGDLIKADDELFRVAYRESDEILNPGWSRDRDRPFLARGPAGEVAVSLELDGDHHEVILPEIQAWWHLMGVSA